MRLRRTAVRAGRRSSGAADSGHVRILVVSDLHYRLPHYDWLVKAADDVDVVALVGDLADVVSAVPFTVQTVVLEKYLTMLGAKTLVLRGEPAH